MAESKSRVIGINVISLFPHSAGKEGPQNAINIAHKAEFAGIQASPLRGWWYGEMHKWHKYVISYEDAFNFGSLWQALFRNLIAEPIKKVFPKFTVNTRNPLILDWVLFDHPYAPRYPGAMKVVPRISKNDVVEINPELGLSVGQLIDLARNGQKYCLDTTHLFRKGREGEAFIGDVRRLIEDLPESSVKLLHVHPLRNQIDPFLSGEYTAFTELVRMLGKRFPKAPAIVEVLPRPFDHENYAKQLYNAAHRCLD
jgi:hypothetical protein